MGNEEAILRGGYGEWMEKVELAACSSLYHNINMLCAIGHYTYKVRKLFKISTIHYGLKESKKVCKKAQAIQPGLFSLLVLPSKSLIPSNRACSSDDFACVFGR